jgi:hypothetical protein
MKPGTIVTQPGVTQKWCIGDELMPVTPGAKTAWPFPRSDDLLGTIYQHTHTAYVYYHPDGRLFDAWKVL